MLLDNIYPVEAPFEEINSIANLRATVNLECPICIEPLSDEVGVMLADNPECGHPCAEAEANCTKTKYRITFSSL